MLLAVPTLSPGKQCWGGAQRRAEPGLLPPCTSVMSSSCRCTVPAREGERKKNRKITLVICLKLCNSRGEERDDSSKQKYVFFGWARNKCLLPPSTTTTTGSSAGTVVCIPVLGSLPKVGGVCPRSCFPGNLLPLWPHHPMQTQIWMLWIKPYKVSNTAGLVALFSTENWI